MSSRKSGSDAKFNRRRALAHTISDGVTPNAPFGPLLARLSRSGPLLARLSRSELSCQPNQATAASILNVETVASFNWLEKRDAHIAVPGMPPMWTPLCVPRKLREDNGIYYRDRNAAHYPSFPIEPTVEAILQVHPTSNKVTRGEAIDIFACASTLGNLFRFVNGSHPDFRVLVERVGDTVHLIRREESPLETIPDVRGYGHSFPESYTTWDPSVRRSSSHQRVILYRLGGLTCLVRFEGDGYLPDKTGTLSPHGKTTGDDFVPPERSDPLPVEDLVSELSVSSDRPSPGKAALQLSKAGRPIPHAAVFDLKTRSIRRKPDEAATVEGEMLRLWLKQIPNLVLAYHTAGTFHDIQIRDVRVDVAKWEETNKKKIACFAKLLCEITEFTRGQENGKLEISCNEGDDTLCLREQTADTQPAFSSSVASRWKTWLSGGRSPDYTACDDECRYCGQCAY